MRNETSSFCSRRAPIEANPHSIPFSITLILSHGTKVETTWQ